MTVRATNIGDLVEVISGHNPTATGTVTITGAAINRERGVGESLARSCVLQARVGINAGGALTSVDSKLQDSADGSTGFADIPGAAITQLTVDETEAEVDVNLIGVKKFIRVVTDVVATGLSGVSANVALGGFSLEPQ